MLILIHEQFYIAGRINRQCFCIPACLSISRRTGMRGSINVMSFDELPHILRRGLDAVFCQFIRDCSRAFPFSPQGKDLFPVREQSDSPRSMFYRMTGEPADDIKLFRAVMPVFGGFAFKFAIRF